jgi:hypothetical protein
MEMMGYILGNGEDGRAKLRQSFVITLVNVLFHSFSQWTPGTLGGRPSKGVGSHLGLTKILPSQGLFLNHLVIPPLLSLFSVTVP